MNNKLSNDSNFKETKQDKQEAYNNNKVLAKKLIEKCFPNQKGKKVSYKDIHNGYTNFSFLVTFENGDKYQVRIPHDGNIINRKMEHDILFKYLNNKDFVYFDEKTGIAVKKWTAGKCPNRLIYKSSKFLHNLFSQIKELHSIKIKNKNDFKPLQFDAYNKNLYRLKFIYQKKFLCLIDRRRDDKLVVSHTDINPCNIIYNWENSYLNIIDYEWACLAPDYFDYANYVREANIKYKKIDWSQYIDNFDMQIFEHYLFMCSIYSYLWTYAMPQSGKIIKYRLKTLKQIRKYYPAVINIDKSCYVGQDENEK